MITCLQGEDRVHPAMDVDVLAAVLGAVEPALTSGPVPEFGSREWLELDESDPRRQHSTTRAAMCYLNAAVFGGPVNAALVNREADRRFNEASKDVRAGVRWSSDRQRWLPVDSGHQADPHLEAAS